MITNVSRLESQLELLLERANVAPNRLAISFNGNINLGGNLSQVPNSSSHKISVLNELNTQEKIITRLMLVAPSK